MCTGNDSCILTFIVEISLVQLNFVLLTLQGGRKCHFNVLFHSQFSVQIINKYEKKYVRQYVGGEPHAVFQLLKWGHLTITFPEGDTLFLVGIVDTFYYMQNLQPEMKYAVLSSHSQYQGTKCINFIYL